MKFNSSYKSLFEMFSDSNERYVRLAAETFVKEGRSYYLLKRKYGPNFDGVNRDTKLLSYMETESLNGVLIRLEDRIKAIGVLCEKYNQTDAQIIKAFTSKSDVDILKYTNALIRQVEEHKEKEEKLYTSKSSIMVKYNVSENTLYEAISLHEDLEETKIYLYYYGINRVKTSMGDLIRLFPKQNEKKINNILLKIQKEIPSLISKIPEDDRETYNHRAYKAKDARKLLEPKKPKVEKSLLRSDILDRSTFFDYIYDNNSDTEEVKNEKKQLIIDYLDNEEHDRKFIIKFYGESYDNPQDNVVIGVTDKKEFDRIVRDIKKFIDKALVRRHSRASISKAKPYEKIFKPVKRGFKKNLFDNFEFNSSGKQKDKLILFVKNYINDTEEISKVFNLFYDDYVRKDDIYISNNDVDNFLSCVKRVNDYIDKCLKVIEFPYKLEDCLVYGKIPQERKEWYINKIREYIDQSDAFNKTLFINLYGENLDTINPDLELKEWEIKLGLEFIDKMKKDLSIGYRNYSKPKNKTGISKPRILYSNFFDFIRDDSLTEEENTSRVKIAIELYEKTDTRFRSTLNALYDEEYNIRPDVIPTKEQKHELSSLRRIIKDKFIIELGLAGGMSYDIYPKESIFDYLGEIDDDKKDLCLGRLKYHFINRKSNGSDIFFQLYGDNLDQKFDGHMWKCSLEEKKSFLYLVASFKDYFNRRKFVEPKLGNDFLAPYITESTTRDELLSKARICIENSLEKEADIFNYVYDENLMLVNNMYFTQNEYNMLKRISNRIISMITCSEKKEKEERTSSMRGRAFVNFFDYFKNIKEDGVLTEENIENIIFIANNLRSHLLDIVKDLYGNDFKTILTSDKVTRDQNSAIRYVVNRVLESLEKEFTRNKFRFAKNFLSQFYKDTDTDEEKRKIDEIVLEYVSVMSNISKKIYEEVYDENHILKDNVDINLTTSQKQQYNNFVKKINEIVDKYRSGEYSLGDANKVYKRTSSEFSSMESNFTNYFIKDDMPNEQKEIYISILKDFLSNSKMRGVKLIKELYDEKFDLIKPTKLTSKEVTDFVNARVYFINFYLEPHYKKIISGDIDKNKKKDDSISHDVTKLKSNILDYFIKPDDSEERKKKIIDLFNYYLDTSRMAGIPIIKKIYDENYQIRGSIKLTDKEYKNFNNARLYFIKFYVPGHINDNLDDKINKESKPEKRTSPRKVSKDKIVEEVKETKVIEPPNMLDLGENSELLYKNDLFDIVFISPQEEIEKTMLDEVLMDAYIKFNDSNIILNAVGIDEETLTEFYLNNIDDLEDAKEAFNYLLHTGDASVIKRLFITPLFLRVVNYLSDIERQVLYLKLLQVGTPSVTDELISKITNVDVYLIKEYTIMTKEDKVNSLNDFIILKRK